MAYICVVCEMTDCIHNRNTGWCKCTTIRIDKESGTAVCGSYFPTSDELKKRLEKEKGGGVNANV